MPLAWVVLLGEQDSWYWLNVFAGFFPSALVIGGHVALLGPAWDLGRSEAWVPRIILAALTLAGAGTPLLFYALFRGFLPPYLLSLALALSAGGLALDLGAYAACRYRLERFAPRAFPEFPPARTSHMDEAFK